MNKKKCFCLILTVTLFLSFSPTVHAALAKGPAQKFARGFTHVVTAPFQIPKQIIQTASETEPFYLGTWAGVTLGTGNGLFYMGRQLVSGFYDMFTFFSPGGRDWAPLFEASSLFPEI